MVKIDLGCGPRVKEGFIGCDRIKFDGVEKVFDIGKERWPFEDGEVDEAHASHFIEHLTPVERCHFVNELYRVLKIGGNCGIVVPHWSSGRAYGDPTHQWPPVAEMWFFYLDRKWRMENAPHTDKVHWDQGYDCHFESTWGYGLNPTMSTRGQDYQQFAVNNYRESIYDIVATLKKNG